jgi:hypothetical protein
MIWKLKERHVAPFERSFHFPSNFKFESMEMKIETGGSSIKLLKEKEAHIHYYYPPAHLEHH